MHYSMILVLLVFITFSSMCSAKQSKSFVVRQLKLEPFNMDPKYIKLQKCEITKKPGKYGLMNVIIHYNNLTTFNWSIKLHRQTASGKYQPFQLNLAIDICNLSKYTKIRTVQIIVQLFRRFDKNIGKPCPWSGTFNATNFDFDAEARNLLPTIIIGEYIGL